VIFYDRECLERFTESDAVSDDATTKSVQLIKCANDAVMLELKQFLPDDCIAD
jgi:hypothetical protein